MYILIIGCTGVGKSSIAKKIAKEFGFEYIDDPYMGNPFIKNAYATNDSKVFQSEMFFFKEFVKIHNHINCSSENIIQERSLYETIEIFCQHFLLSKKMDENEFLICKELLNEISQYIRKPDKIIYLTASTDVIYNRVCNRGRTFEKSIDKVFIHIQKTLYEQWVNKFSKENDISVFQVDNTQLTIQETYTKILPEIKPTTTLSL